MKEETKQTEVLFLVCPICGGNGKQKLGLACPNCSGMGTGKFSGAKFYFWGLKLGQAIIRLSQLRKKIHFFINLFAFLVGLIGLVSLSWWFYKYSGFAGIAAIIYEPPIFAVWRVKHWTLLLFWLSMIADLFIIYRLSEDETLKQKVARLSFKDKKSEDSSMVDDWQKIRKMSGKNKVDVYTGFSFKTVRAIERAFLLAVKLKHAQVTSLHLLFSLLNSREVRAILYRMNVDEIKLAEKIKNQLMSQEGTDGKTELSNELKEVFIEAYLSAMKYGQKRVKTIGLLEPAVRANKALSEILYDIEVDTNKIMNTIAWFRINDQMLENYQEYKSMARFKPSTNMDRAYTAVATPLLNSLAYDLTLAAKWFRLEFCVERDKEIAAVFDAMESGHPGVMLVGETGVGKKSIVHGIAALMVKEEVPKILEDKRLLEVDVSRLVSGASPAAAQERLLTVMDEVARAGNIVLFINNIETIVGITAGEEQSLDVSDVLVNAMEHRGIYCLAAVTRQNYLKYIENKPLGDKMAKVEVEEPVGNQAIIITESKVGRLEGVYRVYFTYDAIEAAVMLTGKYIHDKYLPEKAISLLESLAVKTSKSEAEHHAITKEDVAALVSDTTGIPVTKVGEAEGRELLNLEERIHAHMIDQVEAVDAVSSALRRARAQLSSGKRPIASFLFMGPTGVGKTELAKSVAKVYFEDEDCMIRVDMSEYQNQDSVGKMIGDQQGAKGYLTEAVRQAPFSLLLLDEFEKAHPEILNLFLQVMDDGRLTDGTGRTIDFTNCIIIATSNAGALFIQEQIRAGAPIEKIKEALINEHLNKIMRPELINRFDGVIVFKPLGPTEVVEITKLMLAKTAGTLEAKGIGLRTAEAGILKLAAQGYDPKFGARPLRRLLQEKVENIIANLILAGELKRRDTVVIDEQGEVRVEEGRVL